MLLVYLFLCFNFLQHKNTEQQYIVIISSHQVQASEPRVNSRDQLIVVSEVGL